MRYEFKIECLASSPIPSHRLFENISFSLSSGEILFIQGPNGSGKTTLLRLLAGLMPIPSGKIFWQEASIENQHINFHQQLHYLSHQNGIKLGLTVKENLKLMSILHASQEIDSAQVCHELKLNPQLLAKSLSAGQKRRLALARLFFIPKPLWILDEPCTALDSASQNLFFFYLQKHITNGGIAIMSTHYRHDKIRGQRLELAPC